MDNQGVPGEDDGPQAGSHCGNFFHVRNVRVPVGRRLLDLQVRRQRVHGRRYRATSAAGLQRQNPDDLRVPVLHCYAKGHCRVPQKAAVQAFNHRTHGPCNCQGNFAKRGDHCNSAVLRSRC
uniref:(northern house mosquito) hypothetical protein n=1 Tax=Culex pipiens TaxID=7175 RepID=A0A8D8B7J9_CULPI